MKSKDIQMLDDKKSEVIRKWGEMMTTLDDSDSDKFKAAAIEADITVLLAAANIYLELKDGLSPLSINMANYLNSAADVYRAKAVELLGDDVFKRLGLK